MFQSLVKVLKDVAEDDVLYDHDCLLLCLMSHGQEGAIIASDGRRIKIDDISEIFSNQNCPQLFGKPKLMFLQCCRGSKLEGTFLNGAINVNAI